MKTFNFIHFLKDRLFDSDYYKKTIIRHQMNDFCEKLIAIYNFQRYIQDQTSFTLEEKIYKDSNNSHLEELKKSINDFLDKYKL